MAVNGATDGGRPRGATPGRMLGALLVAAALYYAVWGGEYSALDLLRLREQKAAEAERLSEVRREVESLRALAAKLESDPATLERVARERFGMIRSGEVLYRFVEVDPASAAAPPQRTASRTP